MSKSNKTHQILGLENSWWQDISWQSWSVPGHDLLTILESGTNRLMFANKGTLDYWVSAPDKREVDVLVGPLVGRSDWSGKDLQGLVKPTLQIVNQEVESEIPVKLAGEVEIVW